MNRTRLTNSRRAFTLVELLVSSVVLAVLMLAMMTALSAVQRTFAFTQARVDQFREARQAFDLINRNLSQATLNPYWDYYYSETHSNVPPATGSASPAAFVRQSELQFRIDDAATAFGTTGSPLESPGHCVFFQAPLGLAADGSSPGNLLNARGYGIVFSGDQDQRPPFLSGYEIPVRRRYRLMEYRPAAEYQSVSAQGDTIYSHPSNWYKQDAATSTRVVADNILLLLLSPRVADQGTKATATNPWWIAPNYHYNSLDVDNSTPGLDPVTVQADGTALQGTQHLLPPLVQVTLVAIDEVSAARWSQKRGDNGVDVLRESRAHFTDASRYEQDLALLRLYLEQQKLNYRVFSSTVTLRNAAWDSRVSPLAKS